MSISFKEVDYTYSPNTPFEHKALNNINLEFSNGKITAIIGETGSGKSTLVQHLNGLLIPTKGEVEVLGKKILPDQKVKDIKELRKKVGLVFQFAEYQLFEETVLKDVMFGPKNFGVSEQEALEVSKKALLTCGITEDYFEKSPLEISGGQKRRVALAGVLSMKPQVLVLDEPTAGLDPQGAIEMMNLFKQLNKEEGITIFVVTHNMEHVLAYCDDVVVLHKGEVLMQTDTNTFFENDEYISKAGIEVPTIIRFRKMLMDLGINLSKNCVTITELVKELKKR